MTKEMSSFDFINLPDDILLYTISILEQGEKKNVRACCKELRQKIKWNTLDLLLDHTSSFENIPISCFEVKTLLLRFTNNSWQGPMESLIPSLSRSVSSFSNIEKIIVYMPFGIRKDLIQSTMEYFVNICKNVKSVELHDCSHQDEITSMLHHFSKLEYLLVNPNRCYIRTTHFLENVNKIKILKELDIKNVRMSFLMPIDKCMEILNQDQSSNVNNVFTLDLEHLQKLSINSGHDLVLFRLNAPHLMELNIEKLAVHCIKKIRDDFPSLKRIDVDIFLIYNLSNDNENQFSDIINSYPCFHVNKSIWTICVQNLMRIIRKIKVSKFHRIAARDHVGDLFVYKPHVRDINPDVVKDIFACLPFLNKVSGQYLYENR